MNESPRSRQLGWALAVVFALVSPTRAEDAAVPSADELAKEGGTAFSVQIVDEQGKPVEGALVGTSAQFFDDRWFLGNNDDQRRTNAAGELRFEHGRDMLNNGQVVAWHEDRELMGFVAASAADVGGDKALRLVMHPARHIRGRLTCEKLSPGGKPFGWTNVYVKSGERRLLGYAGADPTKYELLLPPGDYEMEAYGTYAYHTRRPLHVEPGEGILEAEPFDLPPTQLAILRGAPAPELRGVVTWKNSDGLKLSDLKGRYVLLEFWGHWCGPCVAMMPRLFDIRDRIPEDKLAIIGVHVGINGDDENEVDSIEKLDAALVDTRKELWAGRDLPFPVALVRAEETPFVGAEGHAHSLAAADYGISSYPTTILIDREGIVVDDAHVYLDSENGVLQLIELVGKK